MEPQQASLEAGNVEKTQGDIPMEPRQASPEAGNVEKTQKDIPMEPPQASPEAGNVEKTSGRRTSCVVRQRYQLCGQAKAALRFQRHTCLCRAARITNTGGQENHIRHQPQPYKQFSTSSHLSASFKCTTNFHKPDNFLATTLSAVLCNNRLSLSSTGSSVLNLCYLEVCSPVSACQTCLCTH